LTIIVQITVVD